MSTKIFTINELYDLVNAQHSAMQLENETGIPSGWFDFAHEDDYDEKFNLLGSQAIEFEKVLYDTAMKVADDFHEMSNLDEFDYETVDEFWEIREDIQENIVRKILQKLGKYCKQSE